MIGGIAMQVSYDFLFKYPKISISDILWKKIVKYPKINVLHLDDNFTPGKVWNFEYTTKKYKYNLLNLDIAYRSRILYVFKDEKPYLRVQYYRQYNDLLEKYQVVLVNFYNEKLEDEVFLWIEYFYRMRYLYSQEQEK